MPGEAAFLAIDWGSTNRRVYALDADDSVIASERDKRGVKAVAPGEFAGEVAAIRGRFGALPVLCAGMIGSNKGWVEAPYCACPADISALADALRWVDERTAIVPGLSFSDGQRSDVMRGEEVQLLGSVAAGLAPPNALLCQPGTHCKWAHIVAGKVTRFRTTMTGEIFALLGRDSLLAGFMTGAVSDGPAFRDGIEASREAKLLGDLFGVRANILLGMRHRDDASSFVSGLLIGSDVREQTISAGETVHVLADPALGALYAAALSAYGARAVALDSESAFIAGITRIWRLAHAAQF